MGGPNGRRHQPLPRFAEKEGDYSDGKESVDPFAERRVQGRCPPVQAHANQWENGFKLNIPEFQLPRVFTTRRIP